MFIITNGERSIYNLGRQYVALPDKDHGAAELFVARSWREADNVLMCFGGGYEIREYDDGEDN